MTNKATGDTLYLKRHPGIAFTVIKVGKSPARGETVYTVRFSNEPNDTRGFLVGPEDVEK